MSRLAPLAVAAVLLGGCGGGNARSTSAPARAPRPSPPTAPSASTPAPRRLAHPVLIAALGDSITAGSPLWDPDPRVRARMPEQLNDQSQFEYWARRRLGPNARFRNCGVFGETTRQIARRLDTCARGAGALIVQAGINDVYRPIPIERSAANLRAMVRRGRALGLPVALTDVLPWNNGFPRFTGKIERLNALIARIGAEEHVRVLPFFATLDDPAHPGRMRPDRTIDGDHPSVIGYRRLGAVVEVPR